MCVCARVCVFGLVKGRVWVESPDNDTFPSIPSRDGRLTVLFLTRFSSFLKGNLFMLSVDVWVRVVSWWKCCEILCFFNVIYLLSAPTRPLASSKLKDVIQKSPHRQTPVKANHPAWNVLHTFVVPCMPDNLINNCGREKLSPKVIRVCSLWCNHKTKPRAGSTIIIQGGFWWFLEGNVSLLPLKNLCWTWNDAQSKIVLVFSFNMAWPCCGGFWGIYLDKQS